MIANLAWQGLEVYDDYSAGIETFTTELTQNMMLARWKLWLTSQKEQLQRDIGELQTLRQLTPEEIGGLERDMENSAGKPLRLHTLEDGEEEEIRRDLIDCKERYQTLKKKLRHLERRRESLEMQRRKKLLARDHEKRVIKGKDKAATEAEAAADNSETGAVWDDAEDTTFTDDSSSGSSRDSSRDSAEMGPNLTEQLHDDDFLKQPEPLKPKLATILESDDSGSYMAWNFEIDSIPEDPPADDGDGGGGGLNINVDTGQLQNSM